MAVSNSTLIPVEEYLSTVYEPDMDYLEGQLEDRHVGEKDHGKLQLRVARILDTGQWFMAIETRIQVSENRFRVPDICVYEKEPEEQVFRSAPFAAIEILSPEDRMSRMQRKIEDFFTLGCVNIWILDPWRRKAYRYDGQSLIELPDRLTTQDSKIEPQYGRLVLGPCCRSSGLSLRRWNCQAL
jgi:Uma2 family endonuclease